MFSPAAKYQIHTPNGVYASANTLKDILNITNIEVRRDVFDHAPPELLDEMSVIASGVDDSGREAFIVGVEIDENATANYLKVKVYNATLSEDGTRRMYFISIPEEIKTVKEAVSWIAYGETTHEGAYIAT